MKRLLSLTALLLFVSVSFAQIKGREVPSVKIKNLDFEHVNTADIIQNGGDPIIISFWATWCSPCKRELNSIRDMYPDWQAETGVKLVAVSIDDARNINKVPTYVYGQGWEYDVLLDPNGDFKRAMNVNNVPHTFLIDGNSKVVWHHNSYQPGDEKELYRLVQALSNGEELEH